MNSTVNQRATDYSFFRKNEADERKASRNFDKLFKQLERTDIREEFIDYSKKIETLSRWKKS